MTASPRMVTEARAKATAVRWLLGDAFAQHADPAEVEAGCAFVVAERGGLGGRPEPPNSR